MMNGTDNTLFSPESPTTRGMIVTILHRLENSPTSLKSSFADVADSQYCYSAVAWACENGIVNGYGDGRFGPDDNITREQLATVLYRYACWKGLDVSADEAGDILSYQDADNISDYALEAVQWAYDTGLLQGRSQNELQPAASATRGEIAVILQRFATLGQ